eukprot:359869-Chlamydomonas_euryale.AAC.34
MSGSTPALQRQGRSPAPSGAKLRPRTIRPSRAASRCFPSPNACAAAQGVVCCPDAQARRACFDLRPGQPVGKRQDSEQGFRARRARTLLRAARRISPVLLAVAAVQGIGRPLSDLRSPAVLSATLSIVSGGGGSA